ncbi:MAG: acyltransferase [Flavobacterium sp.]|nr:acyltransferase [Flavobacterium sp.]
MQNPNLLAKPHYPILDGLRGVAAVMVVIFHLFEAHAASNLTQVINHGYLAVDFFFVLSGFVIGYAYNDRWLTLSTKNFFKRRLIRLQPMVVMGSVIGAALYYFQGFEMFSIINQVPIWKMLLIMLIGCTLLPVPTSMDIRGWQEMHPLNGPGWSLFFEYIGNILYALVVRHFSKTLLALLVVVSGIFLLHFALTSTRGDMVGGWSLTAEQLHIGFARLLYPFFAGLLLQKIAKPTNIKHGFILCSLFIIVVLAFPRIGGATHLWMNGLYDAGSIIILLPLIVWLGASSMLSGKYASNICNFLGNISYPIYITHYPLIYIYTGWVVQHKMPMSQAWPYAILVLITAITIAYTCLKLYDEPVRKWLAKKWMA